MKCFAIEIWYRLHVKIIDVKFSLVHYDTPILKLRSRGEEHTDLSFSTEPWATCSRGGRILEMVAS